MLKQAELGSLRRDPPEESLALRGALQTFLQAHLLPLSLDEARGCARMLMAPGASEPGLLLVSHSLPCRGVGFSRSLRELRI